jgi:hypothetical protein
MSTEIFAIKIDVMKIDKARLFVGKAGAKYLDAVMIPTPDSKYRDTHMIVQSVSKEERLKGIKGPIIGNAKIIGGGASRPAPQKADTTTTVMKSEQDENIPF